MNNVLQFKIRSEASGFSLNAEVQSLLINLKRLARCGETLQQASGFNLADQVLTHALVAASVPFEIAMTNEAMRPQRQSISAITRDRYDLQFSKDDVCDADTMVLEAKDVLHNWDETALVQYVLDHEIPVDLLDMPGKPSSTRLAS